MSRLRNDSNAVQLSSSPSISRSTKGLRTGASPLRDSSQRKDSTVGITTPRKDSLSSSIDKKDKKVKVPGSPSLRHVGAADTKDLVEEDAIYMQQGDKLTLKAGTIEKLVEVLCSDDPDAKSFVSAFLITFRAFTSAEELLSELVKRFNGSGMEITSEGGIERKKKTQLRVNVVLSYWLTNHFSDFAGNPALSARATEFINRDIAPVWSNTANTLLNLLGSSGGRRKEKGANTPLSGSCPASLITDSPTLRDELERKRWTAVPALEMARQLTLIEHEKFAAAKPVEFMNQAWTKSDKEKRAPNISAITAWFNSVSNWIATSLLDVDDLRERVTLLEYYIRVAQELMGLNNFATTIAISTALQLTPISRLKDTWNELNPQMRTAFEGLTTTLIPLRNFKTVRDMLATSATPCIPYIGIFLTDLIAFDEGFPDTDTGASGTTLINFDKFRKIASKISEIHMYQQAPYVLQSVPMVKEALLALEAVPVASDPEQLYTRSYVIQPKIESSASSALVNSTKTQRTNSPIPRAPSSPVVTGTQITHSAATNRSGSPNIPISSSQPLPVTSSTSSGSAVASKATKMVPVVDNLRSGARDLMSSRFPGCHMRHWTAKAPAGTVYAWEEEVHVEYVEQPHGFVILHTCVQVTRGELAFLQRLASFFQVTKPVSPLLSLKLICIALGVYADERRTAHELDIDLVLFTPKGNVPASPAGDSDSSSGASLDPSPNPLSPLSQATVPERVLSEEEEEALRASELYGEPSAISPFDPRYKKK